MGAASTGGVTEELFAFSSFSLIVMKEPSHFTVGKLFQGRRVDKQGGGGRQFSKEQQPPWVPSARFLKCSQFQRKIAQEKEGAVLLGS